MDQKVDSWFVPCVSYISMIVFLVILGTHTMMSHQRHVAEGDYEKLGFSPAVRLIWFLD